MKSLKLASVLLMAFAAAVPTLAVDRELIDGNTRYDMTSLGVTKFRIAGTRTRTAAMGVALETRDQQAILENPELCDDLPADFYFHQRSLQLILPDAWSLGWTVVPECRAVSPAICIPMGEITFTGENTFTLELDEEYMAGILLQSAGTTSLGTKTSDATVTIDTMTAEGTLSNENETLDLVFNVEGSISGPQIPKPRKITLRVKSRGSLTTADFCRSTFP